MAANIIGGAKTLYRLRVTNLPWIIDHQLLREYFSQYGTIAKARVIFDRNTGISTGTAYIETLDKETFDNILYEPSYNLGGMNVYVRQWTRL